jgi:hypothetical protein
MTFTLGIFDLYTYAIPGAAMASFLAYLGVRLDLVDPRTMTSLPGLALLLIVAGLSFVLGHLLYAACAIVDRVGRCGGGTAATRDGRFSRGCPTPRAARS